MTAHDAQPHLRSHEFDGIREFDNRLPNWWLWTFYLACIFSVGYWIHYHVLGTGALPAEEYALEQAAAADAMVQTEVTDEGLLALSKEPAAVAAGKEIWKVNCAQCHNRLDKPELADIDGIGNIGPNMTDNYWLHGGSPTAMYTTLTKGVVEKGMPDYFLGILGPKKCQQVIAYVLTLKNTNVAGGKEPQGTEEK